VLRAVFDDLDIRHAVSSISLPLEQAGIKADRQPLSGRVTFVAGVAWSTLKVDNGQNPLPGVQSVRPESIFLWKQSNEHTALQDQCQHFALVEAGVDDDLL
jgi:hypothetical protein